MQPFDQLIRDTQHYLQEQFSLSDTILSTPDECAFFSTQEVKRQETPVSIAPTKPSLPPKKPAAPPPPKQPQQTIAPPPKPAEPIKKKETVPFDDFATALRKISPRATLVAEPPSDAQAKRIAQSWKHPLHEIGAIVFSLSDSKEEKSFLLNLTKAIDTRLTSARCVDATEKNIEQMLSEKHLKCLIVPPTFSKYPTLLPHVRELPATGEKYFGNTPLLVLSPLPAYLQQPQLKSALWKKLCQMLQN